MARLREQQEGSLKGAGPHVGDMVTAFTMIHNGGGLRGVAAAGGHLFVLAYRLLHLERLLVANLVERVVVLLEHPIVTLLLLGSVPPRLAVPDQVDTFRLPCTREPCRGREVTGHACSAVPPNRSTDGLREARQLLGV